MYTRNYRIQKEERHDTPQKISPEAEKSREPDTSQCNPDTVSDNDAQTSDPVDCESSSGPDETTNKPESLEPEVKVKKTSSYRYRAVKVPRFPSDQSDIYRPRDIRDDPREEFCPCGDFTENQRFGKDCPDFPGSSNRSDRPDCSDYSKCQESDCTPCDDSPDCPPPPPFPKHCRPEHRGIMSIFRGFCSDDLLILALIILLLCDGGDDILILALCFILY